MGDPHVPVKYVTSYFSPDRGTIDVVTGFIARTQRALDVAVYSVTHPKVLEALLDAHRRGVKIRFLTDHTQAGNRYAIIRSLEAAGISCRRDTQSGLMHHKYAISDGRALATGSYNWTHGAEEDNAENLLILRLSYVVADFAAVFEDIWTRNAPAPSPSAAPRSPTPPKTRGRGTSRPTR